LQALPAALAHRVPAGEVGLAVAGDVLVWRLQREVRGREREVLEERPPPVLVGVLLQALDRVVGDRRAGVVAGLGLDRRERPVVLRVLARGEVPVVVVEAVRVVEPVLQRLAIDVPLAGVVRAVAEWLKHLG
jgi:hypothetical protein